MACRSWRQAARQPELWRYVDMRGHSGLNRTAWLFAIPLSAGQCQWFFGDRYVDDDLLLYLAQQHNSKPFAEALKKLPLLEELALSNCNYRHAWRALEFCPQLKHYIHIKQSVHPGIYPHIGRPHSHNIEAFAIARLPNLLSLQLSGDNLDNDGLSAILNNCPHLESLDLHSYPNIRMDSSVLGSTTGRNCGVTLVLIINCCYFACVVDIRLREHDRIMDKGTRRAPSLKSLSLVVSRLNREPFAETLKKFPLLEELALSSCNDTYAWQLPEFCPQLKHYKHVNVKQFYGPGKFIDIGPPLPNMEAFAIA
uniref:F-box domain-containing protein n=1 Tax=Aegilops tauschii TaxID=37682 RepID=M8BTA5_AEGTA